MEPMVHSESGLGVSLGRASVRPVGCPQPLWVSALSIGAFLHGTCTSAYRGSARKKSQGCETGCPSQGGLSRAGAALGTPPPVVPLLQV